LDEFQLFSVIDLTSEFYQIPLAESSRELTAFSINQGHWHFKRMGMGMKTSPATFQRLMNNALPELIGIKCLVYLDDIFVYGVKQFRPYLYGRKFIILSDHRPLKWLFNLKDPLSKLARWRIQLKEYDYEIRY
jgi:hypothetical protein